MRTSYRVALWTDYDPCTGDVLPATFFKFKIYFPLKIPRGHFFSLAVNKKGNRVEDGDISVGYCGIRVRYGFFKVVYGGIKVGYDRTT